MYMNVFYILYIKVEIYAYCTIYLNGGWLPHTKERVVIIRVKHKEGEIEAREGKHLNGEKYVMI